jgi:hypothetical protein
MPIWGWGPVAKLRAWGPRGLRKKRRRKMKRRRRGPASKLAHPRAQVMQHVERQWLGCDGAKWGSVSAS